MYHNKASVLQNLPRCPWCNLKNPAYVTYHDHEWGRPNPDEHYLYEMLLLETFQAGLSWECILNKREAFRAAYDNFDLNKICSYDEAKITELMNNSKIIRNRRKIIASIKNSQIYRQICQEFGTFQDYLDTFTGGQTFYEYDKTQSPLSDQISSDLKSRGVIFVGSTTIYAYLQAIGIINSHSPECFLYQQNKCASML